MLLVRALNPLDIACDPLTNGITSKKVIYDIVKNYYEQNKKSPYHKLSKEEQEQFIMEHMEEYIKFHQGKLEKKFLKASLETRENVKEFLDFYHSIQGRTKEELEPNLKGNQEQLNYGSYIIFKKYLSTLQSHLLYGSKKITDWISTSSSINAISRYYDSQDIHQVAIIKSNTGGLVDSDNILTVDLSSKGKIMQNQFLCNKIDIEEDTIDTLAAISNLYPFLMLQFGNRMVNKSNENARCFSYSTSSKEFCIQRYIPKDHILSILGALQMDLITHGMFDEAFIHLPKEEQKRALEHLKQVLKHRVDYQDDPFLSHVFEECYMKDRNMNQITTPEEPFDKVYFNKRKILYLARDIPNSQIKK